MRVFAFLLNLCLTFSAFAQVTVQSTCSINKVLSQNGVYFLRSIPFTYISPSTSGKTIVYSKDSAVLYRVDRYFEIEKEFQKLFLSNDGKTIVYIGIYEKKKSICIYRNGALYQVRLFTEFIPGEPSKQSLIYKNPIDSVVYVNWEKQIFYRHEVNELESLLYKGVNAFSYKDSVHLFLRPDIVISMDVNTTQTKVRPLNHFSLTRVRMYNPSSYIQYLFKCPKCWDGPKLKTGESFKEGLAKYLKMKSYPDDDQSIQQFKEHTFRIDAMIDRTGKLSPVNPKSGDPKDYQLQQFFQNTLFDLSFLPEEFEKWPCEGSVSLMNKSDALAQKERKQEIIDLRKEYERRQTLDTIDGVFIPKNLEECFTELNKMFTEKEIQEVRQLNSRNDVDEYHFPLGTWLRNDWGLWGGSRLGAYMKKRGVNNPEFMSSLILEFYYDWLNNHHEAWKKFDSTIH